MTSIQTADPPPGFTRVGKCGRDLHHEGLAEPAKVFAVGRDGPGALDDIVIILVDDDPALLEIAKTRPPGFDCGDLQRDAFGLRRLGRDRKECKMRQAILALLWQNE